MSRSGYSDDCDDNLAYGRYRAIIKSASQGKRGQQFFRDLIAALDALPEKKLVKNDLENEEGAVCALGALGKYRGKDLSNLDTYNHTELGSAFNIASQLAAETMYLNDEEWHHIPGYYFGGPYGCEQYSGPVESEETQRWRTIREWAVSNLRQVSE